MTKAPIGLQELRRRIYRKAKSEKAHRFWGIFGHVTRTDELLCDNLAGLLVLRENARSPSRRV